MTSACRLNYSARCDGTDINFPFKPASEPEDIKPLAPHPDNILSALTENERRVKSQVAADQRAIALEWLLHLVGDIHQPLHTVQLFTREYPHGDRGGNEVCIRLASGRQRLTFIGFGMD